MQAIKMFEENVNIFEHCCSSFVDILRERLWRDHTYKIPENVKM